MASNHSFGNPFMQAYLIPREGERVPLWLSESVEARGQQGLKTNSITSIPYVTSVTVEDNLGRVPNISIRLSLPYEFGIRFLDSSLSDWGTSRVSLRFGYIGPNGTFLKESAQYTGLVLKPGINYGPMISYTINAQGIGGYEMSRKQVSETFTGISRISIVEKLIKKIRAEGETFRLQKKEALLDPISGPLLQEKVNYTTGSKTVLQVIWDLLRTSQCWMTFRDVVGGDQKNHPTIFVVPRGTFSTDAQYRFAYYRSVNGAIGPGAGNVYPILNAESPTMAVYLPDSVRKLLIRGVDTSKPRENNGTPPIEDTSITAENVSMGNKKDAAAVSTYGTDTDPQIFGNIQNPSLKSQAKAELEKTRSAMGINLSIQTVGVPDIVPGNVIRVEGLGIKLSGESRGNYGVFTTSHTLSNSGYTTRLTCVSNTSPVTDDSIGRPPRVTSGQLDKQVEVSGSKTKVVEPTSGE